MSECVMCGEMKGEEEYHVNRLARSGRKPYCKECAKGYKVNIHNGRVKEHRDRGLVGTPATGWGKGKDDGVWWDFIEAEIAGRQQKGKALEVLEKLKKAGVR